MTPPRTASPPAEPSLRAPLLWGVAFGAIQAAAPLGFWWLDPATVYALSLVLIAAVYIGFAVADGAAEGRRRRDRGRRRVRGGGRRSAWSSTGSPPPSWSCC
jgi:hypothetical protein